MDFLSSLAKAGGEPKPSSDDQPSNPNPDHKPSNSDLLASAKLVAEAAQSHIRNEPDKYDKAKAASAAADLLDAASEYGKLDDKQGVGKYINQAEDYLRKYDAAKPATTPPASADHKTDAPPATTTTEEADEKAYGAGDYIKKADDFLNKPSDEKTEASSKEEGGYGDLMKMAGGFLKK